MGVKLNREWRSKGAQQCRLLALSGQSSRTRVCPLLDQSRQISLILLVLLITAANIDKVLQVFGTRGILAGVLFITLGFGIGWVAWRT